MTTLSARLLELFRNLKTDAVPRPPPRRVDPDETPAENNDNNETSNQDEGPEVILIEEPDDDLKKDNKPKTKKTFFKSKDKEAHPKKQEKRKSDCTVNTQATGNVINIVNSKDVRWGDDYYMGPNKAHPKQQTEPKEEEKVEKCQMIIKLMESKIKPEHEYLDIISNNLGKNWYGFFISLGYLRGRIETMELNTREYGVTEARYKLLLDWVRNDDDGTLGKLSTKLWEHGDGALVKKLASMYMTDKNHK